MTSSALTRIFIGGATAQTPFLRMPGGRIELANGEELSSDVWVAPILRDCYATDSQQGLLVNVNSIGIRDRMFGRMLEQNSSLFERGERSMAMFGKLSLSVLLSWLMVSTRDDFVFLPTCSLELFPHESALLPLSSVWGTHGRPSSALRGR